MPAPVIYVLAVVGAVGAAIVLKEFVYHPHIEPKIPEWKERRRQRHAAEAAEVPMTERPRRGRNGSSRSDDGDNENDSAGRGLSTRSSQSAFGRMRDGLLRRRSGFSSESTTTETQHLLQDQDLELDHLATEVHEWRNEISNNTGQDLRQRRNVALPGQAMDESIQVIPYDPLLPTRTNGSTSPSMAQDAASQTSGLPTQPSFTATQPYNIPIVRRSVGHSETQLQAGVSSEAMEPASFSSTRTLIPQIDSSSSSAPVERARAPLVSPPSEASPFHHMVSQSLLLSNIPSGDNPSLAPSSQTSPSPPHPAPVQNDINSSPQPLHRPPIHPFPHNIPSLSQSYPQELEYERGLVLLSPPSSRSESPFSMAGLSPAMISQTLGVGVPPNHQAPGSRAASTATMTGSVTGASEYHSFADGSISSSSSISGWDSDYPEEFNVGTGSPAAAPTTANTTLLPISPRQPLTPVAQGSNPSVPVATGSGAGDPSYFRSVSNTSNSNSNSNPTSPPLNPFAPAPSSSSNNGNVNPLAAFLQPPPPQRISTSPRHTSPRLSQFQIGHTFSEEDDHLTSASDISDLDFLSDYERNGTSNGSPEESEGVLISPRNGPLNPETTGRGSSLGGYESGSDNGWTWGSDDQSNASGREHAERIL